MIQLLDGMMGYNRVDERMPTEILEKFSLFVRNAEKEKSMMLANPTGEQTLIYDCNAQ